MLKVDNNNVVHLTRGDTGRLKMSIINDVDNELYTIQPGDTLRLTLRRNFTDKDFILQLVVVGEDTFTIKPKDTYNMSFGTYMYDVELTTEGEEVYTVIPPTKFELEKEVTF